MTNRWAESVKQAWAELYSLHFFCIDVAVFKFVRVWHVRGIEKQKNCFQFINGQTLHSLLGDETNAFGIQMGDQLWGNLRVKVNMLIF